MAAPDFRIEDTPLGAIRESDQLFVGTHDGTCSRCREKIAETEVPLLFWLTRDPSKMYAFCTRCAFDLDSSRCRVCGCTENHPCDPPCSWVEPDLCSECAGE